jgi:hypothetical protein
MCTLRRLITQVFAIALTGCGGDLTLPDNGSPPDDHSPAALLAFSGSGQQGTVGSKLDQPLVVKLTDASSRPIARAPVVFQFKNDVPGAEVDPEAETNSEGLASAEVRLGASTGPLEVEARVATIAELRTTFIVTAVEREGGKKDKGGKGGRHGHDEDDDD